MARWVKEADKILMIDGCFLRCHGRVLKGLVGEEKIMHIDALPLHRKYSDVFLMDDVPEAERKDVARQVADKIIGMLRRQEQLERHIPNGFSGDLPEIAQSRLGIPGRLDGSTTYKTAQERGTGGAAST